MTRMFFVTALIAILVPLASGLGFADEPDNARTGTASIEIVFVPQPAALDSAPSPASPAATPPSGAPSEPGKEYTSLIVEVDGLKARSQHVSQVALRKRRGGVGDREGGLRPGGGARNRRLLHERGSRR